MTETEFNALAAQGYNRIPVSLETFADLDTPLSIYMKLANGPYTYLLESVQGGERFGRYSIIGLAAQTRIVVNGHQVLVLTGNRIAEREDDTNPLEFIGNYMKRFRAAPIAGLPRFCGGLVGCFGYDTVRYVEKKLTRTAKTFPCRVELSLSEDGPWIDGKSPVQVMRFRVAQGQHLHLRASGEAAAQAISALVDLVRRNFDEEDGERDHPNPACSTSGDGHG